MDIWEGYRADRTGRPIAQTMGFTGKAVLPWFGTKQGDQISKADCRAYTTHRRAQGRSDGAINTELGHLAIALNWAREERIIRRAPKIEKPRKPEPKHDFHTREEVAAMMACDCAPHVKLAIRLMMGTGARLAAALELTWDRVDFDKRQIHLRNPFDKRPMKGRAIAPMSDSLFEALKTAQREALTRFVIEYNGKPIKNLRTGLQTISRLTGIEQINAHKFRHTAAVWLVEDGHTIESVAQFLGHSNVAITYKTYARYSPGYMAGLAQSLEM